MPADTQPPEIFDRRRRRALRERAGQIRGETFLWASIADELADRLVDVSRSFADVLIIGPLAAYADQMLGSRQASVVCASLGESGPASYDAIIEEDRLPYQPSRFDLVVAAGTLDSVNDLPGALVQIRRCLRPDGLFLGHMFGVGTLGQLKASMLEADGMAASPHIHPQIDLRTAADLLSRAGFALPVADYDTTTARYADWRKLVDDVREMGVGNALAKQPAYLGHDFPARLDAAWRQRSAGDGRVDEHFVHLYMSGWAPSTNQPQPARRGSGQVSLTSILSAKLPDD